MKTYFSVFGGLFLALVCASVSAAGISNIDPKSTCGWMAGQGLKSQGWGELGGGDFGCPSITKEFGPASASLEKSDITYYVISSGGVLSELKIFLNVNNPGAARVAGKELLGSVDVLLEKLGVKTPAELRSAIEKSESYSYSDAGFSFRLVKMSWGNAGQYSYKFIVQ